MYLARRFINNRMHYVLRESYREGELLTNRDLVDLGDRPDRFILYPGGSSFYIDQWLVEQLEAKGLHAVEDELEEILLPFLDPYVRQRTEPFRNRTRNRNWKPLNREMRARIIADTHVFDRRRLHFLRFGMTDQRQLDRSPALYRVLLGKSRDELEQLMIGREQELRPHEYKSYIYAIFDLQRFFTESYARTMPQALDGEKMDEFFLAEICRLDSDQAFWQGMARRDTLPSYLVRYLVMYFDYSFANARSWDEYVRSFMDSRRRHRPLKGSRRMTVGEATTVFGVSREELARMDEKEINRLYRRKAMELHPDKGGDHEQFIELTTAYNELIRLRS